jgi:hypothetical protein|tara:strand:- start:3906 stop:4082 length:177 start_codon:yes stop_codon:yes gene_type:complete
MKSVIRKITFTSMQKEYNFLLGKENPTAEDLDMIHFLEQTFDFIEMGEILVEGASNVG